MPPFPQFYLFQEIILLVTSSQPKVLESSLTLFSLISHPTHQQILSVLSQCRSRIWPFHITFTCYHHGPSHYISCLDLSASTVCPYSFFSTQQSEWYFKIISLFKFFQWFSITFRIKSKNPYYDLAPSNCSDFISCHLLSLSSIPAIAAPSLLFERTKHGPAFTLAVPSARNVLHPGIHMACSFISFSSLLKC